MASKAAIATLVLASSWGMSLPATAASDFTVSPLRVDLAPGAASAVVTVSGKTGPGQFFQVSAKRWTQDAQGADVFEDTGDLVFLPKTIDLAKSPKQIIRIGVEKPVTEVEKSYRLFISETPPPADASARPIAQVAVVIDFALPVFVRPAKVARKVEITEARVAKGVLSVSVANSGNVHVILDSLSGGNADFKAFDRWYLLAGSTRVFTAPLPKSACGKPLMVQVSAGTTRLTREVASTADMCT